MSTAELAYEKAALQRDIDAHNRAVEHERRRHSDAEYALEQARRVLYERMTALNDARAELEDQESQS